MADKKLARKLSNLYKKRDNEESPRPESGFRRNRHGFFWRVETQAEIFDVLRAMISSEKYGAERNAAWYSLIGNLYEGLYLEEAKSEAAKALAEQPDMPFPYLQLLALVEARSGKIAEARIIAQELRSVDRAKSFHVSEEELISEYEKGP